MRVPKYVIDMVRRRTKLSRRLRDACIAVDEYCESLGLDYNHPLFDDACLYSDIRIYCEEDAGEHSTLAVIEKLLEENKESRKRLREERRMVNYESNKD